MSSNRKQVLFIESGTTGGGSFESILQHIRALKGSSCDFYVICLNHTRYNTIWEQEGVKVCQLNDSLYSRQKTLSSWISRKVYAVAFYLSLLLGHQVLLQATSWIQRRTIESIGSKISDWNIDIVHLNNQPLRDLYALLVCKRSGLKPLVHLRSMRATNIPRGMASLFNKNTYRYVANSQSSAAYWAKRGFDVSLTNIIYNVTGRKENPVQPDFDQAKSKSHRLGCLANFATGKGHGFLLHAFSKTLKEMPSLTLSLAGKGDKEPEIRQITNQLELQKEIVFKGYQEDIGAFFAQIDALIVPSETEAFGRVILESWQYKTPVIATKVGGITELIEHNYNGLLVNYQDDVGLMTAILRLFDEPGLRSRLVENGLKTLHERFSVPRYLEQIQELYDNYESE